ncbi:tol-pal system protein YbgF [Desulfobacula sp.]|uniref:tol-pal system protein YbgF n=1 Tax=Desulfobacula sp. TaxID=2593537 RepID=UPI0026059B79|nr:tol-pal system protein YbgF [Desulfobacula sp.]
MRIRNLFYIVIALLFFSGCVEPRQFVVLENRVAAIEMENNRQLSRQKEKLKASAVQNDRNQLKIKEYLENLEQRLNKGHSIGQEEYAELKYDIQTIKEDLRRVKGSIEEINHSVEAYSQKDKKEIEKRLERLDHAISKNYEKVIKLEKYMGFEPSTAGELDKKAVSSEEPNKDGEQKLYDFAKKLFDDGDKGNARIQFENFINKYPGSENADNARFWIADSYYSEKWFEKAILEYQKVLEEYPDSNKLAAARLKQGYAFAELGEKANARLILKELLKKHPDSNEAEYAQKKLKTLK